MGIVLTNSFLGRALFAYLSFIFLLWLRPLIFAPFFIFHGLYGERPETGMLIGKACIRLSKKIH